MTIQPRIAPDATHELYIERIFDAPVELVFRVWSSPEHLARWWGPKDFTPHSIRMDFREGGAWSSVIRSPDGRDHQMAGTYRTIEENRRLVFTFAWIDENGPAAETLITVTFEGMEGGRTKVGFHQSPFETERDRDSHAEGWGECLARLAAYVEGDARG